MEYSHNLNLNKLYNETIPYLPYLVEINKYFKTIGSQPGNDPSNYDPKEHTYKYGYGMINGLCSVEVYNKLKSLINYIIIYENKMYFNGKEQVFDKTPFVKAGCDSNKVLTPNDYYLLYAPKNFVWISYIYPGKSNVFKDVSECLN